MQQTRGLAAWEGVCAATAENTAKVLRNRLKDLCQKCSDL